MEGVQITFVRCGLEKAWAEGRQVQAPRKKWISVQVTNNTKRSATAQSFIRIFTLSQLHCLAFSLKTKSKTTKRWRKSALKSRFIIEIVSRVHPSNSNQLCVCRIKEEEIELKQAMRRIADCEEKVEGELTGFESYVVAETSIELSPSDSESILFFFFNSSEFWLCACAIWECEVEERWFCESSMKRDWDVENFLKLNCDGEVLILWKWWFKLD